MARTYSELLLEENGAASATYSAVVPAGFLWVVRDVSCVALATNSTMLVSANGRRFYAPFITFVAAQGAGSAQWSGRQVLTAGQTLSVECFEPIDFRVSGYQLTAT